MKKILLAIVGLLVLAGCNNEISDDCILQLCQYIPDHELVPQARDHMTEDFYESLNLAFMKVEETEDYFGDGEFLFYFVTGNGGSKPYYTVESYAQPYWNEAIAVIGVQDLWEDETVPDESAEKRYYLMILVFDRGSWRIDDFDGKKAECKVYTWLL